MDSETDKLSLSFHIRLSMLKKIFFSLWKLQPTFWINFLLHAWWTHPICFLFPSLLLLQFSSVQLFSHVQLFVTPWIAARQASLFIHNSQSLLELMFIESVMPSSHLILCCPLLLLPPIPPSIRVFSNESTLHMRWPKYWSFSLSISSPSEHPGLISFSLLLLPLLLSHYSHVRLCATP